MFNDPTSVTVNGVAISLPRVALGQDSAVYRAADSNTLLSVRHSYAKRNRHTVRLDSRKIGSDPFISGQNREFTMSAYTVFDHPPVGFTPAEIENNVKALSAWLTTAGVLAKLIGGES